MLLMTAVVTMRMTIITAISMPWPSRCTKQCADGAAVDDCEDDDHHEVCNQLHM